MQTIFFETADDFRNWLQQHHDRCKALLVGYYKVGSGKPSMTWSESVDQALCFGWIDGHLKPIDAISYTRRFTPRRPNSIWSNVNLKKVEQLTQAGLMHPAGIAAYERRKPEKSGIYSFELPPETLTPELEEIFRATPEAWDFFQKQGNFYQKSIIHWLVSAKQEKTRFSRLEKLIAACLKGDKLR